MSDHVQAPTPSSTTSLIWLVHPLKVRPGQLVVDCGGEGGGGARSWQDPVVLGFSLMRRYIPRHLSFIDNM